MYVALWLLGCCRLYVTCTLLALIRKVYIYESKSILYGNNKLWVEMLWKNGSVTNGKLLYPSPFTTFIHPSIQLWPYSSFLSFLQSYDSSASLQTTAASPAIVCWDPWVIYSLSSPPMLSLNLKWDVMLHLHPSLVPCERLDLSEAMEGWEKDLSTAREWRDDLSVYICLVPQPRWGIDVVLRSRSEAEIEKALEKDEQERKVKRFSERIRRSLGSLAFSITFWSHWMTSLNPSAQIHEFPM